jgi:ABC-type transport system substrate-binding protein
MRNRGITTLFAVMVLIIFTTACSSGRPSATPASTTALGGTTPISTTTLNGTTPVSTTTTSGTAPAATTAPVGATLIQERCTRCHPLTNIERSRHTAAEWKLLVDMMISRGANLTSDEESVVVNYLASNFGK